MTLREDILFEYWNGKKHESVSIFTDIKDTTLAFHPQKVEENIKKIEKYCPRFYGEIELGKIFIMEKESGLSYLNHELELIESKYPIVKHFSGKIITEAIKNGELVIKNNYNQILFENASYIKSLGTNYTLYERYPRIKIIVSNNGSLHITSAPDIGFMDSYFYEYFETPKLFILYDINCSPIATAKNDRDLETIKNNLKEMNEDREIISNPLEKQRLELYQSFLYLRLAKKFGIQKQENEHFIHTVTKFLIEKKRAYVYDLTSDKLIEGTFKNCLKLEDGNSSFQIENFQKLESVVEEYKRTLEKRYQE